MVRIKEIAAPMSGNEANPTAVGRGIGTARQPPQPRSAFKSHTAGQLAKQVAVKFEGYLLYFTLFSANPCQNLPNSGSVQIESGDDNDTSLNHYLEWISGKLTNCASW